MDAMTILLIVWAVLTAVLAVLMIYRSTLTMHEDNQIFLDDSEALLEQEQEALQVRLGRLKPIITTLMVTSCALVLAMAGLFVYKGFNGM